MESLILNSEQEHLSLSFNKKLELYFFEKFSSSMKPILCLLFVYFFTDLVFLLGANARLPVMIAGWGPAVAICLTAGFLLARSED